MTSTKILNSAAEKMFPKLCSRSMFSGDNLTLAVSLRDTRPLEGSYGECDIRKMNCVTNTDAVFRDH